MALLRWRPNYFSSIKSFLALAVWVYLAAVSVRAQVFLLQPSEFASFLMPPPPMLPPQFQTPPFEPINAIPGTQTAARPFSNNNKPPAPPAAAAIIKKPTTPFRPNVSPIVVNHSSPSTDNINICGISSLTEAQARIVGGQQASRGEFPWQVSIQAFGTHFCGGMIIDDQWVLTAGHCSVAVNKRRLQIVVGELDLERYDPFIEGEREQRFGVSDVIWHENFERRTLRFDIALLRLDGRIQFGTNARPVCLPPPGQDFRGLTGVISGWGKVGENEPRSSTLLNYVRLPIITNQECQGMYDQPNSGQRVTIRPEWLCAGFPDGQRDACQGDSGGPMVTKLNGRWYISGITSGGFGCARPNNPGIFTRVADFVDWIRSHMDGGNIISNDQQQQQPPPPPPRPPPFRIRRTRRRRQRSSELPAAARADAAAQEEEDEADD